MPATIEPTRRVLLAASLTGGLLPAGAAADGAAGDAAVRPFRANVPQAEVDDLRRRVRATRWSKRETVPDQSQGIQLATMQELVRHGGEAYDWRGAEARLNRYPQFITPIDGVDVHFIHVRSRHPGALPLVISHGWPGSVFEQLKVIEPLTDPTAHGGDAADAFHVVIPSLPGYGFSGQPDEPGWGYDHIALAWGRLMTRLGYDRYVAQGGDWGSPISGSMARQKVPGLVGVHINLPATVPPELAPVIAGSAPIPDGLSDKERAAVETLAASGKMGNRAYAVMMGARPQTIGYSLTDSPAGLAAFLLGHPGFARWTAGDPDARRSPTMDEVLDDISLYWLTNSGTSSSRLYWEHAGASPVFAAAQKTSEISMPVAITVFPGEAYRAPETWARRAYSNLAYFNEVDRGGHFAAWEEPQLFTEELRRAFRPLRRTA